VTAAANQGMVLNETNEVEPEGCAMVRMKQVWSERSTESPAKLAGSRADETAALKLKNWK
jgi:hypothetical protein